MTKTFSFETPVNDGKTFIGKMLISGTTKSVKDYELTRVLYTTDNLFSFSNPDILPLFKQLGLVDTLTFIPVTAHLIKLWGEQEPEAFKTQS